MRIDIHNSSRELLFSEQVDPPAAGVRDVPLNWDRVLDKNGHMRRCPVCQCRELFVRKDFPQKLGLAMVIMAAGSALVLFSIGYALAAFGVLGVMAVIDAMVYVLTPRCLVCYRCRSEFRETPIATDHCPWELPTGEKYRQLFKQGADNADGDTHGRSSDSN